MTMAKKVSRKWRDLGIAVQACEALVQAYDNGEKNGGSVDWEDVDQAHALAKKALFIGRKKRFR